METFKEAQERYEAERIRDERLIRIEAKLDELLEAKRVEGDAVHESVCLDVNAYDGLKIYI